MKIKGPSIEQTILQIDGDFDFCGELGFGPDGELLLSDSEGTRQIDLISAVTWLERAHPCNCGAIGTGSSDEGKANFFRLLRVELTKP